MRGAASISGGANGKPGPAQNAHVPSSDFDPLRCERCGEHFIDRREHAHHFPRSMPRKRFCSERCRRAAEQQRRRNREGASRSSEHPERKPVQQPDFNQNKEAKPC